MVIIIVAAIGTVYALYKILSLDSIITHIGTVSEVETLPDPGSDHPMHCKCLKYHN